MDISGINNDPSGWMHANTSWNQPTLSATRATGTATTQHMEAQREIALIDDELCDLLVRLRRTDLNESRRAVSEKKLSLAIDRLRKWRRNNRWDLA